MASRRKGRIFAFQAIYAWEVSKPSVQDLADLSWLDAEKRATVDDVTAAFSRLLILGTIENIEDIDAMIRRHLKNWDFSRLNRVDLAVLRMSVYSLIYQDEVPPSIIIDEAIDIAKEFGSDDSFRFVNGVLDAIRKTLKQET